MLLPKQPTFTLQSLYEKYMQNRKMKKGLPNLSKQTKSAHIQHPGTLSIASPFSNKNCHFSKDKCKCPFHSYQRFSNIQTYQLPYLTGFSQQSKKNFLKINRQSSEIDSSLKKQYRQYFGVGKISSNSAHSSKFKKNIVKTQNYDHISHKVNCRNTNFQQFLNRNQLLILKNCRYLSNQKNSSQKQPNINEMTDLERYLKEIQNKFESTNKTFPLQQSNKQMSRKTLYSKISLNKNGAQEKENFQKKIISPSELVKIKMIINAMKSSKNIKGNSIKRLSIVLVRFANQEQRLYGHSLVFKQLRQLIDELEKVQNERTKSTKSRKNVEKSGKSLKLTEKKIDFRRNSKGSISSSSLQEICHSSKIASEITIIPKDTSIKKGTHIRRPSIFSSSKILKKRNKQAKTLLNLPAQQNFSQKQNSPIEHEDSKNSKNKETINSLSVEEKMKNRFVSSFRNSKMSFLHMKPKMNSMFIENNSIEELSFNKNRVIDEQELIQAIQMGGVKYQRFHEAQKQKEKIKEKKLRQQIEIQAHLKKLQEQQNQEKLKLKRQYIEKSKNFLTKFRKKMTQQLDLQILVVQDGDSLITQKKKIRFLREMVEKAKANKKDQSNAIYEQIGKYIDFYTHHFNLVLGKDVTQLEEIDISFEQENLGSVVRQKDYHSSLKFINLEHNQKKQKQQRVDGWISIPQYTTVYGKNKRMIKETHKEQKPRLSQQKTRRKQQEKKIQIKQESFLMQKQLTEQMVVREDQQILYETVVRTKGSKLQKRRKQFLNFQEKIDFYRRKVLKRYRTEQSQHIECP